jgi:hypothetical protein
MKIKNLILSAVIAVASLFCTSASHAQGCAVTGFNYTVSYSTAWVQATQKMTITVQTTGSASMQQGGTCGNPTHTPRVFAQLKNRRTHALVGPGWVAGNPGCASCYLSVSGIATIFNPGPDEFELSPVGNVTCSRVGQFFNSGSILDVLEEATTKSKGIAPLYGVPGLIQVTSYCTVDTTPPDFDPHWAIGYTVRPYYIGSAICVSTPDLSPGWHCPIGFYSDAVVDNTVARYQCTKEPAPF